MKIITLTIQKDNEITKYVESGTTSLDAIDKLRWQGVDVNLAIDIKINEVK